MTSLETFIIAVSLIATTVGTLILLACMAGKRAELLKVLMIQKQIEARHQRIRQSQEDKKKKQVMVVSEHGQQDDETAPTDIQTVS